MAPSTFADLYLCYAPVLFFISELCLCAARRVWYDYALPGSEHVRTLIRMEGMKATSILCTRVLLGAGVQQCIKMYTVVCCSAIHARYMYTAIQCLRACLGRVGPTSAEGSVCRSNVCLC